MAFPVTVKINSKVLERLLKLVRDYVEPSIIKRRAKAMAEAKILTAETDEMVKTIRAEGVKNRRDNYLSARVTRRVINVETRRQHNIEAIATNAVLALPETAETTGAVSPDWVAAYIDDCKDIGDAEMQTVWGKILAGEVVRPGSFSLRTLNTVKLLTKDNAALFTKVCGHVIYVNGEYGVPRTSDLVGFEFRNGPTFDEIMRLGEVGLLNSNWDIVQTWDEGPPVFNIAYFKRVWKATIITPDQRSNDAVFKAVRGHARTGRIPWFPLTAVGSELVPICGRTEDPSFAAALLGFLKYFDLRAEAVS